MVWQSGGQHTEVDNNESSGGFRVEMKGQSGGQSQGQDGGLKTTTFAIKV